MYAIVIPARELLAAPDTAVLITLFYYFICRDVN